MFSKIGDEWPHQNERPGLGIQQGTPLEMLGNQTGPQLLDAYELLSLWLFYPFFLFVVPTGNF